VAETPAHNPSYQRILDSAKALFIEQGFPATSMEAIARHANVVRATVYNNFQDKEAILNEIMRRYLDGYVQIPQRLREEARPEQTSIELLEAMIRRSFLWRIDNAELRPLIDLSKHLPKSAWNRLNEAADTAMIDWILEIHRPDAERNLIRKGLDLDFAIHALYSMIEAMLTKFDVHSPRRKVDDAVRQLTLLHWHALYRVDPEEAAAITREPARGKRSRAPA